MQYNSKNKINTLSHNYLSGDSSLIIDIIRVIACEMVVISHTFDISIVYFHIIANISVPFITVINDFFGHVGVILFFIVSGIVISNSLLKNIDINETYDFKNYFIDRFSRIYTGLVPCLIFIFIFATILLNTSKEYCIAMRFPNIDFFSWIGSLFMLQGIRFPNIQAHSYSSMLQSHINTPPFAVVLWTLNIEWWMYLAFGLIAISIKKKKKLNLLNFILLLLFLYYPLEELIFNLHENLVIVWLMGMGITLLYQYIGKIKWYQQLNYVITAIAFLIIGRIGILTQISFSPTYILHNARFYDLVLEVLLVIFILLLLIKYKDQNHFADTKIRKVFNFMGRYSFTLYLTHFIIENLVFVTYLNQSWNYPLVFVFGFSVILSNFIAIIIAYPTEMKYKKVAYFLKKKLNISKQNFDFEFTANSGHY